MLRYCDRRDELLIVNVALDQHGFDTSLTKRDFETFSETVRFVAGRTESSVKNIKSFFQTLIKL